MRRPKKFSWLENEISRQLWGCILSDVLLYIAHALHLEISTTVSDDKSHEAITTVNFLYFPIQTGIT